MSKFVIECPACGRYAEAKTGFFARKKIDCACGHTINVRTDKLTDRHCPHCGNDVVFDQSKGANAKCPVCGEPINTIAEQDKTAEFSCGQCGVRLRAARNAESYVCPVCDHVNNVTERIKGEELKKEDLVQLIKYEGDNSTFVWKHPCEDFNSLTQLIVHESQEAIFFMNGQALDLFGAGRYTLEAQNIPKIGSLLDRTTGGETPFHCEVYFINKTVQMAIKWGTDSKVRYLDPVYGVPLELGASGEMNLMVSDSRKLLVKLVGTMGGIAWDSEGGNFAKSLAASFRPLISMTVKTHLSSCIKAQQINILEVDEHLHELSAALKQPIIAGFEEYGLTIPEFYVTNVVLPENDPSFRRIRELHTITLQTRMMQAEATIKTAQAQNEAAYRTAQEQSKAAIAAAAREAELERQTTETEIARREAERKVIQAQAEAQSRRMAGLTEAEIMQAKGLTEAEVMRAKGYSHKDEIEAEVKKAYAASLGQIGAGGGSGGGGGGINLGDIANLGVTLGAMGGVIGMTKEAMAPMFGQSATPAEAPAPKVLCPHCHAEVPANAKFCFECGGKIETLSENEMLCPTCGKKTHKGKFCAECGAPLIRKCAKCGTELPNNTKFCPECGEKA